MRFISRDLTNQYISSSYQDVVQQYIPTGSTLYLLDGYGNVILGISSASYGNPVITSNDTASYATNAAVATLATFADYAEVSGTSSLSAHADFATSASWSSKSLDTISSSYAATASLLLGAIDTSIYATSASWTSQSVSSSYLNPGASIYLSQSWIDSDISSSSPPYVAGRMFWDADASTYAIQSGVGDTTLQIGQEHWLHAVAGQYIPNGSAVYISGSLLFPGEADYHPIVWLARADRFSVSSSVVGVSTHNITSGSHGMITTDGIIHDLDTSTFVSGETLYLSSTVDGGLTVTPPDAPRPSIEVGICLYSNSGSGLILVNPSATPVTPNLSSGVVEDPTFTDNGNGTFSIGTGSANFYSNNSGSSIIKTFSVNSGSFVASSSLTTYVYYDYNNGYPILVPTLDVAVINGFDKVGVFTIFNYSNTLYHISLDTPGLALSNKLLRRTIQTDRFVRQSGFALDETGSRNVTISAGTLWYGVNNQSLASFNSTTGSMLLFWHSASVWTSSRVTQYNNINYDDGVTTQSLSTNRYAVNYVYRTVGDDTAMTVLGSGNYTLFDAQASQPPANLPQFIQSHGLLTGRIIVQQNSNTASQIDLAFVSTFTPSPTTVHNDLSGLQGGTVDEYYHLTSGEYNRFQSNSSSFASRSFAATSASWASQSIWATSASFASNSLSSSTSNISITSSGVFPISIKTTNYTITTNDYVIVMSGSSNLLTTLPTAIGNVGKCFNIKNVTPTIVTVSGSQFIDNDTFKLITQWNNMNVISDGTRWLIL